MKLPPSIITGFSIASFVASLPLFAADPVAPGAPPPISALNGSTPEQRFFAAMTGAPKKKTELAGGVSGRDFTENAPGDGILVGFELWKGTYYRELVIGGIKAIYQTPTGRVRGEAYGRCPKEPDQTFEAPPGSAVSSVEAVDDKEQLVRLRLEYKQVYYTGFALNAASSTKSEWFGQDDPKKKKRVHHLDTNGKPALGIFGGADGTLFRLGLIYLDRR